MTTNQKLLWGGLGLLVLIFVCCFGLVLGSVLSNRNTTPPPQAAIANTPTSLPFTVVVLEPTATASLEPSPTPTPVASSSTPTPIVIVVTATPLPAEPPTTVPTLPPATSMPPANPANPDADFQAMVQYAEAIKPIVDEGLAAAERDGDILEASKQNPAALCGGGLSPHPTLAADAKLMNDLVNRLNGITPPAEAAEPAHKPLKESMRLWGGFAWERSFSLAVHWSTSTLPATTSGGWSLSMVWNQLGDDDHQTSWAISNNRLALEGICLTNIWPVLWALSLLLALVVFFAVHIRPGPTKTTIFKLLRRSRVF
jgi:hypothetical protein